LLPGDDVAQVDLADDAQIAGDVGRCQGVVAGDHHGADTRRAALGHRFADLTARRIDHADHAHKSQVDLQIVLGRRIRPGLQRAQGHAQHAHAIAGQAVVGVLDAAAPGVVQRFDTGLVQTREETCKRPSTDPLTKAA
jgi:hypothetical protein